MKDSQQRADRDEMLSAVRVNWRLWTILQAELLDPNCLVPDDLRSNILSLAQFVDKHTLEVIAAPAPQKLDVLISINRELAGGLYTQPQSAGNESNGKATSNGTAGETRAGGGAVAMTVSA